MSPIIKILNQKNTGLCSRSFFCFLLVQLFACTNAQFEQPTYVFPGLSNISVGSAGKITLGWEQVPKESGLVYQIFRRTYDSAYDFSAPFATTATNGYVIESYPLDERYCYLVRFSAVGVEADSNKKEICPDVAYVSGFNGIDSAENDGTGVVKISWTAPVEQNGVTAYGIYSGKDLDKLETTVDALQSSLSISDLPVDSTFTFGVRARDKYGRVDSNLKTVTVTTLNNTALGFTGLASATKVSSSSVKLTWLLPSGKPKEFRLYHEKSAYSATPTMSYSAVTQTVSSTLASFVVSGLGDEQNHCFVLRSVATGGQEDTNTVTKCVALELRPGCAGPSRI